MLVTLLTSDAQSYVQSRRCELMSVMLLTSDAQAYVQSRRCERMLVMLLTSDARNIRPVTPVRTDVSHAAYE